MEGPYYRPEDIERYSEAVNSTEILLGLREDRPDNETLAHDVGARSILASGVESEALDLDLDIMRLLPGLNPNELSLLLLSRKYGLSAEEISDLTGMKPTQINTRIAR